jgi:hypothetical protein
MNRRGGGVVSRDERANADSKETSVPRGALLADVPQGLLTHILGGCGFFVSWTLRALGAAA